MLFSFLSTMVSFLLGFGVFACIDFQKGDFLLEYCGKLCILLEIGETLKQ